jgi:putative toxin-antitoxin system antitoxin component (TIGR02293 family)
MTVVIGQGRNLQAKRGAIRYLNESISTEERLAMFYSRVEAMLGITPLRSELDLARLVEERLPLSALGSLLAHGISTVEIHDLIVPRRRLAYRKVRNQSLSLFESDRVVRVVRITSQAEEIFGDDTKAVRWLRSPKTRFEGRTPLDMLRTETGGRIVEEMLHQLDHGFAA